MRERRPDHDENQKSGETENKAAMHKELAKNLEELKSLLGDGSDIKIHHLRFGDGGHDGALVYIDGLTNNSILSNAILRPLTLWQPEGDTPSGEKLMDYLARSVLYSADVTIAGELPNLAEGCLNGDAALMVDGHPGGLSINTKGWEKRSISEPMTETVVRGSREGFTENLITNSSLIRRRIRDGKLHMEHLTVGRKTRTGVCLMFLEGVANPEVVKTIRERINGICVDSILESGYIEQYIEDAPFSPFATMAYSEKPDVVSAQILEGRVAILVDGTPFVLTAPMLFIENFQTAEDYYTRPLYASLIRIVRYLAYLITVFSPGLYIALTTYHQELIPTTLLFRIQKAHEGTPFPVFLEALIMVFAFEILREAGVRLPRPVGQAISIVGALIMGDAAVNAGIVGAPMVITVAVTAVASFLVPMLNDSSSVLRLIMMVLGATVGFYGVALGFLGLLIHLATLESFGVPFFDSFNRNTDMQDTLIRMPLWSMVKRPVSISRGDTTRRRFFIPPLRPYRKDNQGGEQ